MYLQTFLCTICQMLIECCLFWVTFFSERISQQQQFILFSRWENRFFFFAKPAMQICQCNNTVIKLNTPGRNKITKKNFWQTNPLDEYNIIFLKFSLDDRILFEIKIIKLLNTNYLMCLIVGRVIFFFFFLSRCFPLDSLSTNSLHEKRTNNNYSNQKRKA